MPFKPLSTSNSNESNLAQINDMLRELYSENQTKVFNGPNNVNALITGKLPNDIGYGFMFNDTSNVPRIVAYIDQNNEPVLKISGSGADATTASDEDLYFNSNQRTLKILESGTLSLASFNVGSGAEGTGSVSADFSSATVASLNGARPLVIPYSSRTNSYFIWGGSNPRSYSYGAGTGIDIVTLEMYTFDLTTTSITFTVRFINGSGSPVNTSAYSIAYYLMQENI